MKVSYSYTENELEIDHDAAWEYIHHGHLFSPRTVFKGRKKHLQFELSSPSVDLNNLSLLVQQGLETSMRNIAGSKRAIMFSGGFDSMLIGCLAQHGGAQVVAVTVQFDEFNPLTVAGAAQSAKELGFVHYILYVSLSEFLSAFDALAGIMDEPILDLDLAIVYAALKKYDIKIAGDLFISGMGSDQWFGDQDLDMRSKDFASRLDSMMVDKEAHHRVAQAHQCEFLFPFLSESMLAVSQVIPLALKKNKKILRSLPIANSIPYRSLTREIQVPYSVRKALIKIYGHRAWPIPVLANSTNARESDQLLRQIILGIWFEKIGKNS